MDATLFTIGFTKKNAEQFFSLLRKAEIRRVLDIRLNNVSQLAAFAKRDDLRFFLKELCVAEYLHLPEFAPTEAILADYKKKGGSWERYEEQFLPLLRARKIEDRVPLAMLDRACLLCSEPTPEKCHRRLVAEYLAQHHPCLIIRHL